MPILTLDNLLSGFIGAIILFLIQNLQTIISDHIYNVRTKWLIKNYLTILIRDLSDYNFSANAIKSFMTKHAQKGNETISVSYKSCENVHSTILKSDRYRLFFENKSNNEAVIKYYNLCSLIDLLAAKTPSDYSTEYADITIYRSSDSVKFQNSTNRIIVKLDACELNAKEAIKICKLLISKFD